MLKTVIASGPERPNVENAASELTRTMPIRLVTSPGETYAREILAAFSEATTFVMIMGFATARGVALVEPAMRAVLHRGGSGRVVLAVDRQRFNAAAVFEALLAIKANYANRFSVGLVLEGVGLLHAKALYTEGPHGAKLIVGSANLTSSAFGANHELGVAMRELPHDVRRVFLQFVTTLTPRSLDGPDARLFLEQIGLIAPRPPAIRVARPTPTEDSIPSIMARLPAQPPPEMSAEDQLARWISRGYLVGRGRRGLDALVLRLPQEALIKHGMLQSTEKQALGLSSHETRTMGYGIDLLPTADAELLRREARRISLLLAKATLTLPCFGLWMPESFWDVFVGARDQMSAGKHIAPEYVRDLAMRHRDDLTRGGLERETDRILDRLVELNLLVPGKRNDARSLVLPRFRAQLALRTPDMLSNCVGFRTARQRWAPFDQTETPFRQLMVDVVQATFSSTYRTGNWPRRFRSIPGRHIVRAIEERLQSTGRDADGEAAMEILDAAASWEGDTRPLLAVMEEFRKLVNDEMTFPVPSIEYLVNASNTAEADADDARDGDADDL